MLIGKKTGQAKFLTAIKSWRLGWKLRKNESIVAFALPIVAMRKISGDIGNEQKSGKQQRRSFTEMLWHIP